MKRSVSLLVIMLIALVSLAQTQQGVAYRYNGKNPRTPLGNVTIAYDGNKRTTISAENGSFALTLVGRKMGDRIGLVSVKKREMMVFNQHAVDEWSIRKEPLMLILCNADEFEKQKENLINIGRREAKKKYDKQKAELEKQLSASQIKEAEYEAALDKAYEELERLQKIIGEYAEYFVRIDLSEVTAEEQRILDLVHEGKIEEALKAYDKLNLLDKFDAEASSYQALSDASKKIEDEKIHRKNNIENLYDAVQHHVSTLILAERPKEAEQKLYSLLEKLTPLFDSHPDEFRSKAAKVHKQLSEITSSLTKRTDHLLAAINEYTILCSQNPDLYLEALGNAQYHLGTLYLLYYDADTKVENLLNSALTNITELYKQDPNKYRLPLALIKYRLGVFYQENSNNTQAEQMFAEALDVMSLIEKHDDYPYRLSAYIYNALGDLYESLDKKEAVYLQELECYKQLVLRDMDDYGLTLYEKQATMLSFYLDTLKDRSKAKDLFQKEYLFYQHNTDSLSLLTHNNPEKYGDKLARLQKQYIFYFLTSAFEDHNEFTYDNNVKLFQTILENYEYLYQFSPSKYGIDYAEAQGYWGNYCYTLKDSIKAEEYYQKKLEIYSQLNQYDPVEFGVLNAEEQIDIKKKEECCINTIDFLTEKYRQDPQRYGENLAEVLDLLGSLYHYTLHDPLRAEECYLKGIEIYTYLSQSDLEKYGGELGRILKNTGDFYKEISDSTNYYFNKAIGNEGIEKAIDYYLKAEKVYAEMATVDYWHYGSLLADIQGEIAAFYKKNKNDNAKVEEYYLKEEGTYTHLASLDYRYGVFLAYRQMYLAIYYKDVLNAEEDAERYNRKALATLTQLIELAPKKYQDEFVPLQEYLIGTQTKKNRPRVFDRP